MVKTHLRDWMDQQPLGIAMIGAGFASAVGIFEGYLSGIRSGDLSKLPVPAPQHWQSCYRSHKRVCRQLLTELMKAGKPPPMPDGTRFNPASMPPQEQLARMDEFAQRAINGELPSVPEAHIRFDLLPPEVVFFMRIVAPCIAEYGVLPTVMLRRARHGDLDALEKLLRLDWSAMHDPGIAALVQSYRNSPSCPPFLRIREAMMEGMLPTRTSKQLKIRICAWLVQASTAKGFPLTSTQVRGLFDALAKDSGTGQADADLPASPEALAKAIQRERRDQPVYGTSPRH